MNTSTKIALTAPFLLVLSACGGAEETEVVETDAAMPMEEAAPMDPAADPMAADPMATDPMATDPMATDPMAEEPMADDAMAEETPPAAAE